MDIAIQLLPLTLCFCQNLIVGITSHKNAIYQNIFEYAANITLGLISNEALSPTSGLYYKQVTIVIYDRNDIGLYYKTRDDRN